MMNLKLNQRQLMLAALLLLTLIAAIFAPPVPEDELVEANNISSVKIQKNSIQKEAFNERGLERKQVNRVWGSEKSLDLFPAKITLLPPPVIKMPQIVLPPPKPVPPQLPFAYVGKVTEDGKLTVFVSKLDRNYLIKGGEVIDGTYRIDKVEDGRIVFTYLPLETEQIMSFGGKE